MTTSPNRGLHSMKFICIHEPLAHHDHVIKWKHFPRNWPFVREIHRSPVNSPHKGQWRGALMFSLICVWINDWVSNREACDLRHYRAHYDVTVMIKAEWCICMPCSPFCFGHDIAWPMWQFYHFKAAISHDSSNVWCCQNRISQDMKDICSLNNKTSYWDCIAINREASKYGLSIVWSICNFTAVQFHSDTIISTHTFVANTSNTSYHWVNAVVYYSVLWFQFIAVY